MKAKNALKLFVLGVLLAAAVPAAALSNTPEEIPGVYASLFFKADGVNLQGLAVPWLKLNPDGTYHWGQESGTYEIISGALDFNGLHSVWGSGNIDKSGEISFDFVKEGKRYTVKMFRVSSLN